MELIIIKLEILAFLFSDETLNTSDSPLFFQNIIKMKVEKYLL